MQQAQARIPPRMPQMSKAAKPPPLGGQKSLDGDRRRPGTTTPPGTTLTPFAATLPGTGVSLTGTGPAQNTGTTTSTGRGGSSGSTTTSTSTGRTGQDVASTSNLGDMPGERTNPMADVLVEMGAYIPGAQHWLDGAQVPGPGGSDTPSITEEEVDPNYNPEDDEGDITVDQLRSMWSDMLSNSEQGLEDRLSGLTAEEAMNRRRASEMMQGSAVGGAWQSGQIQAQLGGEMLRSQARAEHQQQQLEVRMGVLDQMMQYALSTNNTEAQKWIAEQQMATQMALGQLASSTQLEVADINATTNLEIAGGNLDPDDPDDQEYDNEGNPQASENTKDAFTETVGDAVDSASQSWSQAVNMMDQAVADGSINPDQYDEYLLHYAHYIQVEGGDPTGMGQLMDWVEGGGSYGEMDSGELESNFLDTISEVGSGGGFFDQPFSPDAAYNNAVDMVQQAITDGDIPEGAYDRWIQAYADYTAENGHEPGGLQDLMDWFGDQI